MGVVKFTEEVKQQVISLRLEGKTIPEITAITGMGKPSQQKLYRERGIKLSEEQFKQNTVAARWKNHEPIVDGQKMCVKCDMLKPVSEFHNAKGRKSGVTSSCKLCYHSDYLKKSDVVKERVRKYRQENLEAQKMRDKNLYSRKKDVYVKKSCRVGSQQSRQGEGHS